jgi:hypothetical protein
MDHADADIALPMSISRTCWSSSFSVSAFLA